MGDGRHSIHSQGALDVSFQTNAVFLILEVRRLVVAGFTMLAPPPPASAQSTELLLQNAASGVENAVC